jgi:hypothetical protein
MNKIVILLSFGLFGIQVILAQNPINVQSTSGTVSAATYVNLKEAFDSINNGYQTGNITIQIVGNVTETATARLDSSGKVGLTGTSLYTSISIYPIGKWTISGAIAAGSPLIDLNGADYVTINGINNGLDSLIIANTTISPTSGTCTIRFIGDATNNVLSNCAILGNATMSTTTNGGVIFFSTGVAGGIGNDNNRISNCIIRNNPSTAANFPVKLIYFNGSTSNVGIANSGILIDSCDLVNFKSNGAYINTGNRDITISNNHLYSTIALASSSVVFAPIWISNATANFGENFNVVGNYIGGSAPFCGGAKQSVTLTSVFQTIYLNVASTAKSFINNNVIANMAIATTSTTASHSFIFINSGKVDCGSQGGNTIGSIADTSNLMMNYTSTSATNFNAFGAAGANTTPNFDTIRFENNFFGGFTLRNTNTTGASLRIFDPTGATGVFIIRNNTIGSPTVFKSIQSINANNNTFGLLVRTSSTAGQHWFVGNKLYNIFNSSSGAGSAINGFQHTNATSWRVDSNLFDGLANDAPNLSILDASVTGFKIRPTTSNLPQSVSFNTIRNLVSTNNNAKVFVVGIDVGGYATTLSNNIIINANRVHNLMANTADTANIIGIRANNLSVSSSFVFSNNEVSLGLDSLLNTINASYAFYGILRTGGLSKFYNNSVLVSGNNVPNSVSTYCFYSLDTAGVFEVKNNVFNNTRSFANLSVNKSNIAANFNGVLTSGTFANSTCNYNLYHSSGTGGANIASNGQVYTLTAWQANAYAQNNNSISGNPLFVAPNMLQGAVGSAIGVGDNTLGVTTDILTNTRNNYYMGAYDLMSIVPVKLVEFKASKSGEGVLLNWATATELNNKGFFIERADKGNAFAEIAFINGHGTWNGILNYTYYDQLLINDIPLIYYRLKQIDYDGKFVYSKVVSVNNQNNRLTDVNVYPNPTHGNISVNINSLQIDAALIQIYLMNGELIASKNHQLELGENSVVINEMNELENGVYVLKIQTSTNTYFHKIVKL